MFISDVNITENESMRFGLMPIKMKKLGNVVVICGKNGSGKSRLFRCITELLSVKPTKKQIEQAIANIDSYNKSINSLNDNISRLEIGLTNQANARSFEEMKRIIEENKQQVEYFGKHIQTHNAQINWNMLTTDVLHDEYNFSFYNPRKTTLSPCCNLPPSTLKIRADEIFSKHVEIDNIATSRIQYLHMRNFIATHQDTPDGPEKQAAVDEYTRLQNIISELMGETLRGDFDGNATIFGSKLDDAKFSDGQTILLQLSTILHAKGDLLNNNILFLDEPENHLHPASISYILDKIISSTSNSQIWIATHSINIASQFDPESLWLIDNGKVTFSGRAPEAIIQGLIGNDEKIERLQSFISMPDQLATINFAHECLFPPNISIGTKNDPQTDQIINILSELNPNNNKIKLLDFGAGKGRLLKEIFQRNDEHTISERIDYYTVEQNENLHTHYTPILSSIYKDGRQRSFKSITELHAATIDDKFDLVIMCNVLHEISPSKWIEIFSDSTGIPKIMKDNASLVIVEDQQIFHGEAPNKYGFIILDEPELKLLFHITQDDYYRCIDHRLDGRLKAHFINKQNILKISKQSREEALKCLKLRCLENIQGIRTLENTYKNGKKHALWTQMLANTTIALTEI